MSPDLKVLQTETCGENICMRNGSAGERSQLVKQRVMYCDCDVPELPRVSVLCLFCE